MNQDKLKQMYANGGLLKALLKDPAQRKMAAQMLGGKEYGQGGMMKYANGGPVGPGGKKIPTSQEYVAANMPYYKYGSVTSPDYSGEEGREKFKEKVMLQALPQMMLNQMGSSDRTPFRQMEAAMDSYQPGEGESWSVDGLRKHIVNTLGPDHRLVRPYGSGSTQRSDIQDMFNNLGEYLDEEGVFEQGLYQVDPATGQETRVTQEMYEQLGSPTEFARVRDENLRSRYYLPSAASELQQRAFNNAYRNPDMSTLSTYARFR